MGPGLARGDLDLDLDLVTELQVGDGDLPSIGSGAEGVPCILEPEADLDLLV